MLKKIISVKSVVTLTVLFTMNSAVHAQRGNTPSIVYPRAIQMAERRIERFVETPSIMRDKTWKQFGATDPEWRTIDLLNSRELPDGMVEYTLRWIQRDGLYHDQVNRIKGPRLIMVAEFGPLGGPNEPLSAFHARQLIEQHKRLYREDSDYKRIVDLIETQVINKLTYDWEAFYGGFFRTPAESLRLGFGVCDVYADLVTQVLGNAGYTVEKWSSSAGNHAWNHVRMPNGRTLYIDATWYDNAYENHPTNPTTDGYEPWYITYDKTLFEHGLNRTINMHGGWPDARRVSTN